MALRIGGKKAAPPPVEEPMPMEEAPIEEPMPKEEAMAEELPEETLEEEPMAESTGTVDPMQVMYKDGAQRSMEACGNCKYYGPEGACSIVAGPIDPEGICNIYASPEQEEEMPMEAMPEEEMPMEEMQEPEAEEASQEGY